MDAPSTPVEVTSMPVEVTSTPVDVARHPVDTMITPVYLPSHTAGRGGIHGDLHACMDMYVCSMSN